jgi:hypothetical protein
MSEDAELQGVQLDRFYYTNTKCYANLHFSNVVASPVTAMPDIANSRNIFHLKVAQVRVPLKWRYNR